MKRIAVIGDYNPKEESHRLILESIKDAAAEIQSETEAQCSRVRLFRTPWTAAYQAPPSMGFSRQEYWSGCHRLLPCHCSSFYFLWVLVSFTSSVAPGVLSLMRFHALSHKGRCLTQGPAESAVYLCDISNYCREGCETQA